MDLNIENYSFDEIRNIFGLPVSYSKQDLKRAYKLVYKAHPDKSNLGKEYFIFLKNAIQILEEIHELMEKEKQGKACVYPQKYTVDNKTKQGVIKKKLSSLGSKEFHQWFNEQFEFMMGNTKERISRDEGYEEWLNSQPDYSISENQTKEENWKDVKQQALRETKQLTIYQEPITLEEDCIRPSNSTLHYEDVKRAHTECVVPVFEEDVVQHDEYNMSFTQYCNHRQQSYQLMNEQEALKYLEQKREQGKLNEYKAYQILQEQKRLQQKEQEFWGKLQLLE